MNSAFRVRLALAGLALFAPLSAIGQRVTFLASFGAQGSGDGRFFRPAGVGLGLDILCAAGEGTNRISRFRRTDDAPAVIAKGPKSRTVVAPTTLLSGTARRLEPGITRIQVLATDLSGKRSRLQTLRIKRP